MSSQRRVLAIPMAVLVTVSGASPLSAQSQSAAAAPTPYAARTIDLTSPDGIALKASYLPGRPGPGILLLHACNRDRSSWNDLATEAAARGFHVLALDYRGYGQSGGTRSGQSAATAVDRRPGMARRPRRRLRVADSPARRGYDPHGRGGRELRRGCIRAARSPPP